MRKQEEAMRIMEALSGVDEELLARCEAADKAGLKEGGADVRAEAADEEEGIADLKAGRRTGKTGKRGSYAWRYLSRCAAVLVLAAAGALSWRGFQVSRDLMSNESTAGGSPQADGMANFALVGNSGSYVDGESNFGSKDELKFREGVAGDELLESSEGSQRIVEDTGPSDENAPCGSPESDGLASIKTESIQSFVVPAEQKLTEEEARQVEILGNYVPKKLPAGYVFESAGYVAGSDQAGVSEGEADASGEGGRLTIRWSRGADDIVLRIELAVGGDMKTTDVQKTETYDVRSDKINYSEPVTQESQMAFGDPVFAKDDFSLEIVRSRVISYNGNGEETTTPGGNFSVLYDGVAVHFDGRGMPEEIWEMFASIAE